MKTTILVITSLAAACSVSLAALPSKADLRRLDGNDNGNLERSELEQLSDQKLDSALDAYDRNNDSEISESELEAGPQREKKAADKDKQKANKKKQGGKNRRKKGGGKKGGNQGGGNKGGGQKKAPKIPRIAPA